MPVEASPPEGAVVQCSELVVRYGPVTAVDQVSFEVDAGEVVALLGPNGAGKTSTVESLEGYRRPASGRVRVLGLDPIADRRTLMPRIGVMLQKGGVYPVLGPRRVLRLFSAYYDRPRDAEELLELVSLQAVATTPWRHLSGGEQQRLSLALALVGRPEVVFLDEPTAGVDPEGRQAIRRVVADLAGDRVGVLLTTHELAEAERMAHRVVIVRGGRVVSTGTPAGLAAAGAGEAVRFGAPVGLDVVDLGACLGAVVTEEEPGRYLVSAAATPSLTAALAAWLAGRDATMTDLRSGRTLEEVYLEAMDDDGPRQSPGEPSR